MSDGHEPARARRSRARRIPQQELRERMLDAAEEQLGGRGLGVNALPLNLEELIRRVGVPRSSAFHAFGSKENLVFELALRMLQPDSPLAHAFAGTWMAEMQRVLDEHPGRDDPAGRSALLDETIRRAARANHDVLAGSAQWRTFRALSMSLDGFPDDERAQLAARLRLIQDRYVEVMGGCYERVFDRFGVRMRPGIGVDHFTRAASSALEGIATNRAFGPEVPDQILVLPGVEGEPVPWHLAAVALRALVAGLTEPVPTA